MSSPSPSPVQLAAPANIEESENASNLHSTILMIFLMGVYTTVYFATLYIYLARKTVQRFIVVTTITALYVFSVIQFACQWSLIQWEFITNGQTQDSVFVAYDISPEWINILIYISSALTIILADGLLIWRCYHVWDRSMRVLAFLALLWSAESGVSVASIAVQGIIGGTSATEQLALLANHLVSAQYFLALATSVATTCLIAYKIHSVSKQSAGLGFSSHQRFKHILDVIVQSSVVYSLTLLLMAIGFVLPEEIGDGRNTRGFAFLNYSAVLGLVISGLAPTVMVTRVALLAGNTDLDSSSVAPMSGLNFLVKTTGEEESMGR
ncbi:hypothetical protein CVT26_012142 [Gymnopilus dilepis]|uniref:Uncharacterized protein n=1 Tax=Gymnopilus dilepis TaxID=231916 RepID=A0A409W5Q2_9AGAR|nr:hypothetical protein CVT26_012142 [Gymnopilus dilepis]